MKHVLLSIDDETKSLAVKSALTHSGVSVERIVIWDHDPVKQLTDEVERLTTVKKDLAHMSREALEKKQRRINELEYLLKSADLPNSLL
jgi:DNA-binding LacI/PurR family transcriptional regulator